MKKKLSIGVTLLTTLFSWGQHSVKGTFTSQVDFKWASVYQVLGANERFISYDSIQNNKFNLEIPKGSSKGMYRLSFGNEPKESLSFIYTNHDINIQIDSKDVEDSSVFLNSPENSLLQEYNLRVGMSQKKIEQLQVNYLKSNNISDRLSIEQAYEKAVKSYDELQDEFINKAKGKDVENIFKALKWNNSPVILKTTEAYFKHLRDHFLDNVDFNDPILYHSPILASKAIDYIFSLHTNSNSSAQEILTKKVIDIVMNKIGDNDKVREQILAPIIYTYIKEDNTNMASYIMKNYYDNLDPSVQNSQFVSDINGQLRTAICEKAPNFDWSEEGNMKSLYGLSQANAYVIIFWSSTCGHCLQEIPKAYKYLKGLKDIQVIAVAIEDEDYSTYDIEVKKLKGWHNIKQTNKGKWNSTLAEIYGIEKTPSFFLLNKDKEIIAKAYDVKELKEKIALEKRNNIIK